MCLFKFLQKERFRYFIKVPELAAFYNEITDYRTAEDVGVDRPAKNEILHNIPPTPQQEDFIEKPDKQPYHQGNRIKILL